MRRVLFLLTVFVTAAIAVQGGWTEVERIRKGNLLIEGVPEIPASVVERLVQYQNTRSVGLRDWSPVGDGLLIGTRFGETTQLHFIQKPGGARRQITFFSEPVGSGEFCPDPSQNGFLFTKDVGGGEFYQIFWFDLGTGRHTMLTDGKSRNGSILWSNKGDRFAFTSTKRNGRDHDIYLTDIRELKQAKWILQEGGAWRSVDWSPDDSQLLVAKYISINESYIYILDVGTGKLEQINPSDEKISYGAGVWARDGKGIYLTSDENSEFRRLRYYEIASKTFADLTSDIDWDVADLEITKAGDRLAFTTNENGISKLYLLDTVTRRRVEVPGLPLGNVSGLAFDPSGTRLAMTLNTPRTPGDLFVLTLKDLSLERWTHSEIGGLNSDSFVEPELIEYETFDQVDGNPRKIPAFFYKPRSGNRPYPVLILIHGGPEGQYVPRFSATTQYYAVELGIAVLAPNVRGSAGYGKSYLKLDNGFNREDSVKDIGGLLDWIEKQPELDASRVGVMGGSYGGYMVLACMTHFDDRLRAGIESVGISNFVTFLENTQAYRRDLRRAEYGDERDPEMREFLVKISPTTNAHKIRSPMLIVQGLNDPRVPASESEQILETIRTNQSTAWYILAEDEGHGFRKKSNRDFALQADVLFLQEFLLK